MHNNNYCNQHSENIVISVRIGFASILFLVRARTFFASPWVFRLSNRLLLLLLHLFFRFGFGHFDFSFFHEFAFKC